MIALLPLYLSGARRRTKKIAPSFLDDKKSEAMPVVVVFEKHLKDVLNGIHREYGLPMLSVVH